MRICKLYKSWFVIFFLPAFVCMIFPALNVWRLDVSLQWNHPFHPDGWYVGFNERRQKTNYLAEHSQLPIDTVFIGSSRTSYINPEITGTKYGFNYAVSSGNYKDYEKYLAFAQECSSKSIDNVWLELSYFQVLDTNNKDLDSPDDCIREAKKFSSKLKTMFSHDAVKISSNSVIPLNENNEKISGSYMMLNNKILSYKTQNKFYAESSEKAKEIAWQVKSYEDRKFYSQVYDEQCLVRLKSLASSLEGKQVVVYMPPVGQKYMELEVRSGQLANHERFLREAVEAFGEVWDFAYPNDITMNDDNFQDAHHATIETLEDMIGIIQNAKVEDKRKYLVTKQNLEEHIQVLHRKYMEIK